jgi:peptidoglycan hydrolase CwlO-like protein
MNIKKLVPTTLVTILLVTFFIGLMVYKDKPVSAATTCPGYMSEVQCYNYLLEQFTQLQKEQGTLQNQLNEEQYKQLTLEDKITYISNQVTQTQNLIKSLEIEIAAHDIEIKILEQDIQDKEDSVSLLKQEISVLEGTVNQRIAESYKYSFLSTFDLFLDSKSFSNILRKTKYLIVTRAQDIASLEDYAQKATELKREEDALSVQKADLVTKQNGILAERSDLAAQNKSLEAQIAEKNSLLAQSQAKSASLLSALRQNKTLQAQLDAAIITWINAHMGEIVNSGPVARGSIIGYVYPGSGKCSTGAHLHFGIDTRTSGTFTASVDPFAGYLVWGEGSGIISPSDGWNYPYVRSNMYQVPIAGTVIMTQDYHSGRAIDLSRPNGAANAPVLSAYGGTLYRGYDSNCQQNYAIVVQSDGKRSIYVHLR